MNSPSESPKPRAPHVDDNDPAPEGPAEPDVDSDREAPGQPGSAQKEPLPVVEIEEIEDDAKGG